MRSISVYVMLVLHAFSFQYASGAYSFTTLGGYANTNFTWALGTPNVTIRFISDEIYNFNVSKTRLYWRSVSSYRHSIGYAYYDFSCRDYGYSPFDISCSSWNETHFVIDFVLKQQYSSNDVGIIQVRGYNSGSKYYDSTTIKIKHCSNVNEEEKSLRSRIPRRFEEKGFVECESGPVFARTLTPLALHPIGRRKLLTCGLFGEWIEAEAKQLTCWKGEVYDFSKYFSNQTTIEGESTLFYCDEFTKNATNVSLSFNGTTLIGTEFTLFNKTLTQDDYNATVTCRSHNGNFSNEKSIRLNVLFPPPNSSMQDYYVTMHSETSVAMTFRSNPPVVKCGSIEISKDGKRFTNFYAVNDDVLNKIVFHFRYVTIDDLGTYNVTVTPCDPFNNTEVYYVEINAGSNTAVFYTEKVLIISLTVTSIGILLLCALACVVKKCYSKKSGGARKITKKRLSEDKSQRNPNNAYNPEPHPSSVAFRNEGQAPLRPVPSNSRSNYYLSPSNHQQQSESYANCDVEYDTVLNYVEPDNNTYANYV